MKNIVLVHGAWADGSSWSVVIQRLQAAGYKVSAAQLAFNSLDSDVAIVRSLLEAQDGPTILVGHSFGGAVITRLGADAPNVAGLVYVAAFAPATGESMKALITSGPQLESASAFRPDSRGFIWLDPDGFLKYFAPDVEPAQARALAAAQKPIAISELLGEEVFERPAWQNLPAWYLVTMDDQMIPPQAQQFMAQRMGAKIAVVASSHVPMFSHPDVVVELITTGAS